MMKSMRVLGGLVSLAASCAAAASLLSYPGPSNAAIYISPVVYNHTLTGPVDAAAGLASFYVTQWSNNHELFASNASFSPPPSACPPDLPSVWGIATPSTQVCLQTTSDGMDLVYMRMDGRADLPCGAELDLFLSPVDPAYTMPTTLVQNVVTNVPLSAINSSSTGLRAGWSWQTLEATVTPRCGTSGQCGPSGHVDYAYLTLGLVLGNPKAAQTFFYQVIFYDTRGDSNAGGGAGNCGGPCDPFVDWFEFPAPTVGVSDAFVNYGNLSASSSATDSTDGAREGGAGTTQCPLPCSGKGDDVCTVSVPVYTRLFPLLAHAVSAYGLDGDLSEWFLHGYYVGLGGEGSVTAAIRVGNLTITY
jgi:hypothetical protein